jgi:hypothetical protein
MTAITELTAQPITRSTLLQLLSSQGQAHENLGAGMREAACCLADAQAFYDLPAVLSEPLGRFRWHLDQAFVALEEARELVASEADLQQSGF